MKEEDIRPKLIFDEYLRLAALDAVVYFRDVPHQALSCPACGGLGDPAFQKHGFTYEECPNCQTIFVSPRPAAAQFFRYYTESDSAQFFATTFYRATANARREKLWRPKAKLINEKLVALRSENHAIFDIGGGYGIFAEEYERLANRPVTVIEPGPKLASICREKGLEVLESFLEKLESQQLPAGPKAFVSFELFEHLHDARFFLKSLMNLMSPGDLFMFTTLSSSGTDIRALWDNSKSFSLQHLNFFNPTSIRLLIEEIGLKVLSVETPGQLDIDIISNTSSDLIKDRFWRNFIQQTTDSERHIWQKFLAERGFSSHMFVVCGRIE